MSELLIRGHLGLGDLLICNALIRHHAKQHNQTLVLCKPHNIHTASWLFRDDPKIEVFQVDNDQEADECVIEARKGGFKTLVPCARQCTPHGDEKFDMAKWDQEFYRIAEVPFEERWSGFKAARQPSRELAPPTVPFALIHQDGKRGYNVDLKRVELKPWVFIDPSKSPNLFDWWGHIEQATELHLMESCVAVLADSLPLINAKRKVIHHYCRKSIAPTYRLDFEHIF